jgi:hypothetical protein
VSWGRNQWMHRRLFHLRPRGATNRSTSAESPGRGAYKDTRLFHHGPWTWRQTVLKRPASSREANYRQCLECQAGRRIGGECVCMWIRIITEHIISNACRCHKVQCPCPVSPAKHAAAAAAVVVFVVFVTTEVDVATDNNQQWRRGTVPAFL